MRADGRAPDALRPIEIITGYQPYAEGSALISFGDTRVLCAASVSQTLPTWLEGRGRGWVTAEYAMLPRATNTRHDRERLKISGRTQEIQRLIGRSLRAAVSLPALDGYAITIDCDVLQADGGTRTASVTGGYVALMFALRGLVGKGLVSSDVFGPAVAAVSVGLVEGEPLLDLAYVEDSRAQVDFNVVMNDQHAFIEVQGTAEGEPFSREALDQFMALAEKGLDELFLVQQLALSR